MKSATIPVKEGDERRATEIKSKYQDNTEAVLGSMTPEMAKDYFNNPNTLLDLLSGGEDPETVIQAMLDLVRKDTDLMKKIITAYHDIEWDADFDRNLVCQKAIKSADFTDDTFFITLFEGEKRNEDIRRAAIVKVQDQDYLKRIVDESGKGGENVNIAATIVRDIKDKAYLKEQQAP